jgi:hypothetical protein
VLHLLWNADGRERASGDLASADSKIQLVMGNPRLWK